MSYGPADGRMVGQTDGQTDGHTLFQNAFKNPTIPDLNLLHLKWSSVRGPVVQCSVLLIPNPSKKLKSINLAEQAMIINVAFPFPSFYSNFFVAAF